ncbi:MAG: superinfection immunity protein [Deferrisomatales bacterium]|nr:superinfection immunity protein [Deferrisomatales bacterium]
MSFPVKLVLVLLAVVLYFLPSYLAMERQHHLRRLICAINILLGWTLVGWVVALAISLTAVRRRVQALDDYFGDR